MFSDFMLVHANRMVNLLFSPMIRLMEKFSMGISLANANWTDFI